MENFISVQQTNLLSKVCFTMCHVYTCLFALSARTCKGPSDSNPQIAEEQTRSKPSAVPTGFEGGLVKRSGVKFG